MKNLKPFDSEQSLNAVLERYGKVVRQHEADMAKRYRAQMATADGAIPPPTPTAMPSPAAAKSALPGAAAESVTNTQTAGVDEGGIVKVHGRHLVILRRGRLFTVEIGSKAQDSTLRPVAMLDAFGPDIDPGGAWYDEMLLSGDTIAVIGYSYARGGTEIGLFNIDAAGQLSYRATYHLRSNDYYSSRNYASRLIGDKLIFYTPLYLNFSGNPLEGFPALRKWQRQPFNASAATAFQRIAPATRIYRTDDDLNPLNGLALHTVTVCDLSKAEMTCQATAILGPRGRVFYVSGESVYVWTTEQVADGKGSSANRSALYRIPLNGTAPTAVKTQGVPIDQFSFLESGQQLNVLLRAEGRGEGMWGSEVSNGDLALLRLPHALLGDGTQTVEASHYQPLPKVDGHTVQNRYIGPCLLYGSGESWGHSNHQREQQSVQIVRLDSRQVQRLELGHSVDRVEALGDHALIVGTAGRQLHFSSVRLDASKAADIVSRYTQENAVQGETRSHGFFYLPESPQDGLLGLPVRQSGSAGYQQLHQESAAILYLRNRGLKLHELGALAAQPGVGANDGCKASCVDWYGNSRPLFLRQRIFALMGYELVEGQLQGEKHGEKIHEIRRISYAPSARPDGR